MAKSEKTLVEALGPPHGSIDEYYKTVTLASGQEANIKIWRSNTTPVHERPLILMFHGGGFMAGSIEMCTRPGHGLDVTRWLSEHAAEELGASPEKGFIVGGLSAGGNMAAVLAYQLRKEALPSPITGSFISIAPLLIESTVPTKYKHLWTSRKDNAGGNPYFGEKGDEKMVEILQADAKSPLYSPTNDLPGLEGLSRTYLQLGDKDPLRDDGVVYAKALEDAGVQVRMDVIPDTAHDCFSIWYDEEKGSPKALKTKTMEGVAWLLGRTYTESD
ncbi:hypothetical protein PRZ48_015020 [Zasmidium cellare]|uniref:Alpha/beta hydrolase fold-3 domain-containing protein n=1 Tax=Zasmidium cellare TaxID=395010 RepID=A0ABR0DXI1_ZASCE|nr:hypothetical protein PRZ48_015020 [Zasmidium cellare]